MGRASRRRPSLRKMMTQVRYVKPRDDGRNRHLSLWPDKFLHSGPSADTPLDERCD